MGSIQGDKRTFQDVVKFWVLKATLNNLIKAMCTARQPHVPFPLFSGICHEGEGMPCEEHTTLVIAKTITAE